MNGYGRLEFALAVLAGVMTEAEADKLLAALRGQAIPEFPSDVVKQLRAELERIRSTQEED